MLKKLANEINQICIDKGWNEDIEERTEGDWAALAHTEISEAFESHRNGEPPLWSKDGKPEGAAVEYIDCMIRILHWFAVHKIDPDEIMRIKLDYNRTRPYRHGGKKV